MDGPGLRPVVDDTIGALFTPPYALLLGRRTYDIFAAYWPYADGDDAEMGEALTAAEKHVLTRGDGPLPWENSHRLKTMADVAALKATDGPDLLIQGSSTIYAPLLAAGLIDRLVVMTFPVLLGAGKRPFGDATPAGTWKLVEHRAGTGASVADLRTRRRGRDRIVRQRDQRPRGRAPAADGGGQLVIELYGHPFSSYTWKGLIPFYENDIAVHLPRTRPRPSRQ